MKRLINRSHNGRDFTELLFVRDQSGQNLKLDAPKIQCSSQKIGCLCFPRQLQDSGRCFESGNQFLRNTKLLMAKMAMKDWTPTVAASDQVLLHLSRFLPRDVKTIRES